MAKKKNTTVISASASTWLEGLPALGASTACSASCERWYAGHVGAMSIRNFGSICSGNQSPDRNDIGRKMRLQMATAACPDTSDPTNMPMAQNGKVPNAL